jgi:hypothetical protein
MNLIIKVSASAIDKNTGKSDEHVFAALHGVASDEVFSEYIDSDIDQLKGVDIKGGILVMDYDPSLKRLWSKVTYLVPHKLNLMEEAALTEYTVEQLLDGIGDNLAQEYVSRTRIFIIPANSDREISVEYVCWQKG